MVIKYIEIFG